jgi:hypothetical protein
MLKHAVKTAASAASLAIATVLAGCGGGGEAEFVKACMAESGSPSGDMFQQQMGVSKEAFCKCGAKTAKSSMSGKAFHAMVLDMQGKKQEAYEITSKLSESEQQEVMMAMGKVFQSCAKM